LVIISLLIYLEEGNSMFNTITLAITALLIIICSSAGADSTWVDPSSEHACRFCFRGKMAPACDYFMIVELGAYFGNRLLFDWELGVMHNHNKRLAYGFSVIASSMSLYPFGADEFGNQVSLLARIRHWLSQDFQMDYGIGPALMNFKGHKMALTGTVSANFRDLVALSGRADIGKKEDGSGLDTGLYCGVNLCSYSALTGIVAEGLILVVAFIIWVASGG